jgi:hypothetical protein
MRRNSGRFTPSRCWCILLAWEMLWKAGEVLPTSSALLPTSLKRKSLFRSSAPAQPSLEARCERER